MTYETRELGGSMFKNRRKEKETHPDLTGEAKINGVVYWVSAWQKTDKNGNPWFSFSFKAKDFTPAKEAAQKSTVSSFNDDPSDDIPW